MREELRAELLEELRAGGRRRDLVIVGAALLLGGLVWLGINGGHGWPGWVLAAAGVVSALAGSRR